MFSGILHGPYDVDSMSFFQRVGITNEFEKAAYSQFFIDAKTDGTYTFLREFWALSQTLSGTYKGFLNASDLTVSGTSTPQNKGGVLLASGAYLRSTLRPNAISGLSLTSAGLIGCTNGGFQNGCIIGAFNSTTQDLSLYPGAAQP